MTVLWLFTGVALIINGLILKYYPPKRLTWWSNGIRLPFATKNEMVWKEANRYMAMLFVYMGLIMLAIVAYLRYSFGPAAILPSWGIMVMSGCMILLGLTKAHINKHFDENGNRK